MRGPAPGSPAEREGCTHVGRIAWVLALPAAWIGVDHLAAWQAVRLAAGLELGGRRATYRCEVSTVVDYREVRWIRTGRA